MTTPTQPLPEVTQLYCPKSGGAPDEDNTTHHIVAPARGGRAICRYCRRTENQIRDAVGEGITDATVR